MVKIAGEGMFIDPESGEQRHSAGVGSGVIVSENGLVVTNNHVVTGAALLRVYVPGKTDPVNAKIVGVSECSDLAVIQLLSGDYTPLEFRTDEVTTGLAVYAAGYPANDVNTIEEVDYTLTRGIVSSRTANGETSWASVDEVIEHDARIRGGNSGGPLLDESPKRAASGGDRRVHADLRVDEFDFVSILVNEVTRQDSCPPPSRNRCALTTAESGRFRSSTLSA